MQFDYALCNLTVFEIPEGFFMKNLQIVPVKGQEMINTTAKLANEIWHQHFTPIIGIDQVEYMIDKFQSVPALTKQLEEGYEYFLILSDGKPAGYSGIHVKENSLFLSKLYVHENSEEIK